jgi:coenzyme PQQ precursor peptide PqqA
LSAVGVDSSPSPPYRSPVERAGSREKEMKWKTPVIIEIAVGLEINAYACAEVK